MKIFTQLALTDIIVFIAIITIFLALVTIAKLRFQTSNVLSYLSMGRSLTLPVFVVTLVSSWYGNVLGAINIAYKYGIYNFFVMGFFWYLSALVFAFCLAGRLYKTNTLSLPELVGNINGAISEKVILVLMIIKTLPITYIMAFTILLNAIFDWSNYYVLIIVIVVSIVMGLRTSLKSVIIIDFIQFLTIFVGLALVVYYCVQNLGGIEFLELNLPNSHLTISGNNDIQKILLWLLVAFSTTVLSPIFHQRCNAVKTPATAKIGIVISIIFWIASDLLTTFAGLYTKAHLGSNNNENAYFGLIILILPTGILGYVLATIFISVISALDSYLFATKSLIINYYRGKRIILSKFKYNLTSIFVVLASALIAQNFNDDFEKAWLLFESAFIAGLLPPIIAIVYFPKILTSTQFNTIIITIFTTVLIIDYQYLSMGTTFCLKALAINLTLVSFCSFYNYFKIEKK